MKLTSSPGRPLQGTAALPGDKSLSHRAALFAALAEGESRIDNFLVSGVTQAMLQALAALGVSWQLADSTLTVQGRGLRGLQPPVAPLECGNSATTIRLLAGALAVAGVPAILDGSPGLRRRPMERIVEPLQQMGVPIQAEDGRAPLSLQAGRFPLCALDYALPVASAQVKTCLLLAALAGDGPTTLREPGLSRDHTERMLGSMGVTVTREKINGSQQDQYETRLVPPKPLGLNPINLSLPGDFSSAAFLITVALITPGSTLILKEVGLNPGRTGLLDALLAMGARIQITAQSTRNGEPVGDLIVKHSQLHAAQVAGGQVSRMIDEFPVFAIAAAFADGITTVKDAAELRHKESDRISALCQELGSLGVNVAEYPDGFSIHGSGIVRGGIVQAHNDHRLAMSLAVAGLAAEEPVILQGAEIISESFPGFVTTMQNLGADLILR
ncbi:MAG TPA: 3-phosphoshikimate 1-carboxyvinyltransferase [Anaerolineales bacterium]|nr:3-phosphoshikimate 1-carboxyvinyltransferase [Anaerolineales bacterium]